MIKDLIQTLRGGLSFVARNDASTVLKAFNRRDTHPFLQFIKYGICGVAAVIVHNTVFYLLACSDFLPAMDHSLVDGNPISDALRSRNSLINNFVGFLLANYAAYRLNVLWVFQPGRHSPLVEFGLFSLVSGIAFVGGSLGGPLLIKLCGIGTHLSQALFIVTSACVNYLCRKFFIFQH